MDGKEAGAGFQGEGTIGAIPKELPSFNNWNLIVPLEHVLIGSSIDDPDKKGQFLGGVDILKRDSIQPGFSLQFPPEVSEAELKEFRGNFSYMDNASAIFDPKATTVLNRGNYRLRVVLPPVNLARRMIADPVYEVQLTKEIIKGTDEEGKPRRKNVPVGPDIDNDIKEAFLGLQLHPNYAEFFSKEEISDADILSFRVKYKG